MPLTCPPSAIAAIVVGSVPPPSVLILSYPSNPTAMVASLDFYRDLVAFARKHIHDQLVKRGAGSSELAAAAPFAEQHGIKLGVEVHAPLHFDHPWIMRHAETMERVGSPVLGFIPDMGIFNKHFPRVIHERFLRQGANEKIAEFIVQAYDDRVLSEYVIRDVRKLGGNPIDIAMAETIRHTVWSSPKRLLEFMPRIFHIHGKFLEMTEDLIEPSIAYDEVIPVLKQGGFDGYISSEYEGNRHIQDAFPVDSVEQVRRHQLMLTNLIAQA